MTELQQNRYDQLLRRVGDLKGPGSKVNDALSELFPMFDVETDRGELQLLSGMDLCFGGGNGEGAATTAFRGQLFNPVGSGKLLIVTRTLWTNDSIAVHRWGVVTTALTTGIGTETFRDTRHPPARRPTGQIRTQISVALAPATGQVERIARTPTILEDPNGVAVLAPGTGLELGQTDLNIKANFTFYWRERVAQPSEINF